MEKDDEKLFKDSAQEVEERLKEFLFINQDIESHMKQMKSMKNF